MGCCGEQPDIPDPSVGYAAGILADLESLPMRRRIEAAAQLGIPVEWLQNGRTRQADFTGLGETQQQREYADQMAQQLLSLQRDLGPQFVQQRLEELQRSDPEGFAMRRDLWDRIRTQVNDGGGAVNPAAAALQEELLSDLQRGGRLPDSVATRVSQEVLGGQVARGNWLGNAPGQQEAGAVAGASEAWKNDRQQAALQFLTSGVSPDDAAQRRDQQGLNNVGSFISGETPQAQFGQVSGAQAGAVPWNNGGVQLPGTNPNAGAQGINFANGLYAGRVDWRNQQVSPWVAGLSGAFQGANLWQNLGGGQRNPQSFGAVQNWNAGAQGFPEM